MTAQLADLADVEPGTTIHGEVVDTTTTPCSADEAKELISKAITAADEFQSAVAELLSRQAHIALGYDSPRDMIIDQFSGALLNPRTKKPLSRTHLRRLARVTWVMWVVASHTQVDIGDINLSENALRSISSAESGLEDRDLIDAMLKRIDQLGVSGPDGINEVLNEAVHNWSDFKETVAQNDSDDNAPSTDASGEEADGADDSTELAASKPAGPGSQPSGGQQDRSPSPDTKHRDTADDEAGAGEDAGDDLDDAQSLISVFEDSIPDGLENRISDLDVNAALAHMRTAADVRRALRDIAAIYALLPTITSIRKDVPEIIDNIDDDELAALRAELATGNEAVDWAEKARAVIAESLSEVQIRFDTAI